MSGGNAKRLVRSKSGLKKIPLNDYERSPFELKEPEWIPDKESPTCMDCNHKFDFLNRRHHCRRCGKLACGSCCEARLALPRMCFLDPVRLCSNCAETTSKENNFYNNDLKTLISGASVYLSHPDKEEGEIKDSPTHCRLSTDHRQLFFSPSKLPSISMYRIISSNALYTSNEENEGSELSNLNLQVEIKGEEEEELIEIHLKAPNETFNTSSAFLQGLHSAVLMVIEARSIIGTGE